MRSRRPFQVGFTYAATLVPVLKKCSTDLSRENIMKQAAMARSGTARADSGSSRTRLIHAVFDSLLTQCWGARSFGPTASIVQLGKRNFAGRDRRVMLGADRGRTAGIRFADRGAPR